VTRQVLSVATPLGEDKVENPDDFKVLFYCRSNCLNICVCCSYKLLHQQYYYCCVAVVSIVQAFSKFLCNSLARLEVLYIVVAAVSHD
jgi:hypothetical protein